MAVGSRLVNLVTLSSFAVFICSLQAIPVTALSLEQHPARAVFNPAHDALAKRKRSNNSKRCKPRPAPSAASTLALATHASSSAPAPASSPSFVVVPSPSSAQQHSSAPPAPSPSQPNTGGSSKGGLAWPNGAGDLPKWKGLASTVYTWGPTCPDNAQSLGMTCCPMLWGFNQVEQWKSQVMNTSPPCVMGPNEPEIPGQSNISPDQGLFLWNTYIRTFKGRSKLISPATTSDPGGKAWMQEFFSKCGGTCDVDFLAVHWYDVSGDALISYLEDLHQTFGLRMWLTEFACQNFNDVNKQCSMEDVWGFQKQVTAYMKQTSFLAMYAPFGAMKDMQGVNSNNQLMNSDGSPNALAHAYFS